MDINGKFKSVTETDLYDFYGIASLNIATIESDELKIVEFYIKGLKQTYMKALQTRFAYWHPNGSKASSIENMIKLLRDGLDDEAKKQSLKMAAIGSGFNMRDAIKQMRGETEESKKKAEIESTKKFAENLSKFDSDKYPMIARGVIKLHESASTKEIILAVDHLNDLQHWGGAILVDLVVGHRSPDDKEGNRIFQEIMDIKKNAKSPLEFVDKMSEDIREIVIRNERDTAI
jgi:hypothetical protein